MSLFRSKAIVLKKTKIGEKEFIYSLFSYDYGKIDVVKKISAKEKPLDIGYNINFEIHSGKKNQIHKISHIKILSEFDPKWYDFTVIHNYLELIQFLYKNTQKGLPIYELYHVIHELHQKKVSWEKICLSRLKMLHIFWELSQKHDNPTAQKILLFIHNNSIKNILRLSGVDEDTLDILQKIYN